LRYLNFYKNEGAFPRNVNTIKQIHFALVTFHPSTTPLIYHPFHNLPIYSNTPIFESILSELVDMFLVNKITKKKKIIDDDNGIEDEERRKSKERTKGREKMRH
jgi:hypothetical protein